VDKSSELPVYLRGAERMAAGEEIYRRGTDDKPFTYPPFAAVPMLPLRLLPAKWQAPAWFLVGYALLLAIAAYVHRWAATAWPDAGPPRLLWLWLVVVLIAGRHVSSVFENQSHDLLVAAPLALGGALWCRRHRSMPYLAAAAAGLGAAIKATPLLFLEVLLVRRSWWAAGALALAFALLSFAPDLIFPRLDHRSWAFAWYDVNLRGLSAGGTADAAGAWNPHSVLNQSLSGTLTRLLSAPMVVDTEFVRPDVALLDLPPWLLRTVVLLLQAAVVAAVAWCVLRARAVIDGAAAADLAQRRFAFGEWGAVLCAMVLLSPQSSKSHFCVLLLPAAFCADRLLRGRRDWPLLALVAGSALLAVGTTKELVGRNAGNLVLGLGSVTWSTVLLLSATLRALAAAAAPADKGRAAGASGGKTHG
jgi:hypothetical protein